MPLLFIIMFINMMGFGMIFPLFPLLKLKFLLNDLEIGYIVSYSALATLIGGLILGYLSDKIGRKYMLVTPLLLLGLVYFLTGRTDDFNTFFALRVITGVLLGNFAIVFACTSDLSSKEDKFKNMGLIGASFGLGFIFGPAIGGYLAGNSNDLSQINFVMPFDVAGILCIVAGIITIVLFKETLSKADRKRHTSSNIFTQIKIIFSNSEFVFFSFITLIFHTIGAGIQVFLGILLNAELSFTPKEIGIYWGIYGLLMSIFQIILTRYFTKGSALIYGFIIYGISIGLLTYSGSSIFLILSTIGMVIGFSIIGPNISGNLALQGEKNQQGTIFGINQSFSSLGRIVGPNLFAFLYYFHHNIIWLLITALCLATSLIIYMHMKINYKKT